MNAPDLFMKRGAAISTCSTYRWTLTREWGEGPKVCYIGHNPSDADASIDDPTVLAWIALAKANGYSRLVAVNVLPYRSPDVRAAHRWARWDQNGPDWSARDAIMENEAVLAREIKRAGRVVACWGALCADDWGVRCLESVGEANGGLPDIYCLGTTAAGDPKHAMARGKHRVPRDFKFKLWRKAS